jgi:hypothetical protein
VAPAHRIGRPDLAERRLSLVIGHHGAVLRRRVVLLPLVGLLLTGCLRLEAPEAEDVAGEPAETLLPVSEAASGGVRLEPSCPVPEPGEVLGADDYNEAFQDADLPYWQSADVGASAVLSDGRVVWMWGDTIREKEVEPEMPRMVDNSMLVTSGTCISQLVDDAHGPALPRDPNRLSVWPMSVNRIDPRPDDAADVTDVLVVFCSRVQRGDRMWDFIVRGTTVAVYTVGADGVPRLSDAAQLTPDDANLGAIHWGAASAVDGDWVYVYGSRNTGQAYVYGHELYAARLPIGQVMNRNAMQYWDGRNWQGDSDRVVPVIGADTGVAQTLSVDLVDGKYVAYSKLGGDLADQAATWTSDSPTGPFVVQPVLSSPAGQDTGYIQYTPLAHPDVPTTPGQMLVSVSRNVDDYELLLQRPQLGRPLFSEVPRP